MEGRTVGACFWPASTPSSVVCGGNSRAALGRWNQRGKAAAFSPFLPPAARRTDACPPASLTPRFLQPRTAKKVVLFVGQRDGSGRWEFGLNPALTWADVSVDTKLRLRDLLCEAQVSK